MPINESFDGNCDIEQNLQEHGLRKSQAEISQYTVQQFSQNKQNYQNISVLLNLATGYGKSYVIGYCGLAFLNQRMKCKIVVPENLIAQLKADIENLVQNTISAINEDGKKSLIQLAEDLKSYIVGHKEFFLLKWNNNKTTDRSEVIIVDEAHLLQQHLLLKERRNFLMNKGQRVLFTTATPDKYLLTYFQRNTFPIREICLGEKIKSSNPRLAAPAIYNIAAQSTIKRTNSQSNFHLFAVASALVCISVIICQIFVSSISLKFTDYFMFHIGIYNLYLNIFLINPLICQILLLMLTMTIVVPINSIINKLAKQDIIAKGIASIIDENRKSSAHTLACHNEQEFKYKCKQILSPKAEKNLILATDTNIVKNLNLIYRKHEIHKIMLPNGKECDDSSTYNTFKLGTRLGEKYDFSIDETQRLYCLKKLEQAIPSSIRKPKRKDIIDNIDLSNSSYLAKFLVLHGVIDNALLFLLKDCIEEKKDTEKSAPSNQISSTQKNTLKYESLIQLNHERHQNFDQLFRDLQSALEKLNQRYKSGDSTLEQDVGKYFKKKGFSTFAPEVLNPTVMIINFLAQNFSKLENLKQEINRTDVNNSANERSSSSNLENSDQEKNEHASNEKENNLEHLQNSISSLDSQIKDFNALIEEIIKNNHLSLKIHDLMEYGDKYRILEKIENIFEETVQDEHGKELDSGKGKFIKKIFETFKFNVDDISKKSKFENLFDNMNKARGSCKATVVQEIFNLKPSYNRNSMRQKLASDFAENNLFGMINDNLSLFPLQNLRNFAKKNCIIFDNIEKLRIQSNNKPFYGFDDDQNIIECNHNSTEILHAFREGLIGILVDPTRNTGFSDNTLQSVAILIENKADLLNDPLNLLQGTGRLRGEDPCAQPFVTVVSKNSNQLSINISEKTCPQDLLKAQNCQAQALLKQMTSNIIEEIILYVKKNTKHGTSGDIDKVLSSYITQYLTEEIKALHVRNDSKIEHELPSTYKVKTELKKRKNKADKLTKEQEKTLENKVSAELKKELENASRKEAVDITKRQIKSILIDVKKYFEQYKKNVRYKNNSSLILRILNSAVLPIIRFFARILYYVFVFPNYCLFLAKTGIFGTSKEQNQNTNVNNAEVYVHIVKNYTLVDCVRFTQIFEKLVNLQKEVDESDLRRLLDSKISKKALLGVFKNLHNKDQYIEAILKTIYPAENDKTLTNKLDNIKSLLSHCSTSKNGNSNEKTNIPIKTVKGALKAILKTIYPAENDKTLTNKLDNIKSLRSHCSTSKNGNSNEKTNIPIETVKGVLNDILEICQEIKGSLAWYHDALDALDCKKPRILNEDHHIFKIRNVCHVPVFVFTSWPFKYLNVGGKKYRQQHGGVLWHHALFFFLRWIPFLVVIPQIPYLLIANSVIASLVSYMICFPVFSYVFTHSKQLLSFNFKVENPDCGALEVIANERIIPIMKEDVTKIIDKVNEQLSNVKPISNEEIFSTAEDLRFNPFDSLSRSCGYTVVKNDTKQEMKNSPSAHLNNTSSVSAMFATMTLTNT